MVLTPTYHVFHMYVPFQDATFVPLTFDAGTYTTNGVTLPRVDADRGQGQGRQDMDRRHQYRRRSRPRHSASRLPV